MQHQLKKELTSLTPQPFLPKLRHTYHVHQNARRLRTVALLLAVILLGAQFHLCADFNAGPATSHACPICNAASAGIVRHSLLTTPLLVANRLETSGSCFDDSLHIPPAISPRAPPTSRNIS